VRSSRRLRLRVRRAPGSKVCGWSPRAGGPNSTRRCSRRLPTRTIGSSRISPGAGF